MDKVPFGASPRKLQRQTRDLVKRSLLSFVLVFTQLSCNTEKTPQQLHPDAVGINPPPEAQQQSSVPDFDGEQAFRFLLAQTNFGPRNPSSVGHHRCLDYLAIELQSYAEAVDLQRFAHIGYDGERYDMTNILSSFNLQATDRIMLAAHWDTRPMADQEKDPEKRKQPILGANDGASGVAVVLEIARQMKLHPPPIGVDIILFDGEDFGKEGDLAYFSLGARYFAKNMPAGFNPRFGVLLDMVGDKQLELLQEENSLRFAADVVRKVWSLARELGFTQFSLERRDEIFDDHIPLNQAGIRTINIIDFDYPDESNRHWHTLEDTPDKCSPESLEAVGTVLMHLIYATPM
ncbi:MAG: M28 family peptidase [Bacteroidota bacterium]